MQEQIYSKSEKEHFHIARLKKGGETFEISIEPDLALKYREGKDVPVHDILLAEDIFSDVKRGEKFSEHKLEELFHTTDVHKIAEKILKEGEIQLTQEYREKLRAQKVRRIIEIIHQNGIDPRTNSLIPIIRIENAFEQKNIRIEEHRTAEDQVKRILKDLTSVLPIKFELKEIEIKFGKEYSGKGMNFLKSQVTVVKNNWNNDGTLTCTVQVPAGMVENVLEKVNSFSHGNIETSIKKVGLE